jgi:Uma2 family endonuclease
MGVVAMLEWDVEIPAGATASLAAFRQWTHQEEFPEAGRVEVETSGEDLFLHGAVKAVIAARLQLIAGAEGLGQVWIDSARVGSEAADLSAEPDVIFASWLRMADAARLRLVSAAGHRGRFIEFEGGPDLVVEIVSDSSVGKDTQRLPPAYFAAGVEEFWLVDARVTTLRFVIHRRGSTGFEPVAVEAEGWQFSALLNRHFRLVRTAGPLAHSWQYDLQVGASR